jgi:broad specificity phosphatase PhoE
MIQEDEKRILTPLGRQQAHLTGKRIAEMMKGAEEKFGPCRIQTMRVSGLTRARETAAIIATHLPGVTLQEPDPILNEGRYDALLSDCTIQCFAR